MTKKHELRQYIRRYPSKYIYTSDIINYGHENYFNRANREKCECVKEGLLKPLTTMEQTLLGLRTSEGAYEIVRDV